MDYRVTDPYLDPPGAGDAAYSEVSVRLPSSVWVFQPPDDPAPIRSLPAAKNGFVTFGCLNQFVRVSRPALELWVKILQALPGARLVVLAEPCRYLEDVRALFLKGGIAAERIRFVPRAGRTAYFARYHDIDLGLDPFPYNGHTSTLDAFWMGVPVVTLAGRTAVGRVGVSNLANVGLPELIARTPEEYVAIAVAWATDLLRLATVRAELRQRLLSSPMADCAQYAADMERAYRWMWERWCRS
jgi:predicted O-linked N-acetylglucosamine transferase (SPINDLY family)